jgi:hypothetical protein
VTKPRRARMLSRLLPLSVHAGRSCLRGALSTTASSLPPGAFGLVPLLHDDRPRISAPMITTPNTFSNAATPVGGIGSRRPVQPCPTRGAGSSSRTWNTPPAVSAFEPTHHRATNALASVRFREIERDPSFRTARIPRGVIAPVVRAAAAASISCVLRRSRAKILRRRRRPVFDAPDHPQDLSAARAFG